MRGPETNSNRLAIPMNEDQHSDNGNSMLIRINERVNRMYEQLLHETQTLVNNHVVNETNSMIREAALAGMRIFSRHMADIGHMLALDFVNDVLIEIRNSIVPTRVQSQA